MPMKMIKGSGQIMQFAARFDVPEEFKGHTCDVNVIFRSETGDWKHGWNFDGASIIISD